MRKFLTFFLTALLAFGVGWAGTVIDEITLSTTGVTTNTTSYTTFSGKHATSDAVYAGKCAGGNASIQLRSKNDDSGVITTGSGGKVKSVTIEFNTNTTANRTVEIYGKNNAYSAASDLFDASTKGTLLGTAQYYNGAIKTVDVSGDYTYVGIRSKSDALYIAKITIVWEIEGGSNTPYITVDPETGLIINDATGDNKTGTLTPTLHDGQGDLTASTSSSLWSWSNNTVTFNGKELFADGTVTFSSTGASDVNADLEYNYVGPLYIIGTVNGGGWSANNMVDFVGPDDNGIYTATFESAVGEDGKSWISFSKRKGTNWDSWSQISDYRFTPLGDTPYTAYWLNDNQLGTWIGLDFDPSHVDSQPLRMDPDTYTITIDAKNNRFKIERYETPVAKVYNKVVHESQLIAGKKYILVNEDKKKYCGEITLSGTNSIGYAVDGPAISDGSVDIYGYNDIKELTLGNDEGWTFHNGDGYLHYPEGNQLDVVSEITNGQSKWTVSSSDDGFILTNAYNTDRVLQYNSSSPRFACYTSAQSPAVLYVEDGVEPVHPAVAEPVITPNGGSFAASQQVTITCETSGATIRYTTDGTDPTATTGTVYEQALTLTATTTVKAIAVLDEVTSQVVSATFTKTGIETIAAANALSDNTQFTFIGDAVVTFHRSNHLFVRDASGSGLIYGVSADNHQFNNGDVLKPEWKATYKLYTSSGYTTPEFINPSGVEFKENNGAAAPEMLSTLVAADVNKYVGFNNVTVVRQDRDNKNYYITVGENDICLRAAYEELVPSLVVGKTYNVTGVVAVYENNPQLNLISATIVKQDLTLGFNPAEVSIYVGDTFTAPALTGVPEGETINVTYSSSNTELATVVDNVVTLVEGATGTATITANFAGNDFYNATTATYTITVSKKNVNLAFAEETPEDVYVDNEVTLTVTGAPEGVNVTFECDPEGAVTFDGNKATFKTEGPVTITAKTAATDEYNAGEVSKTFNVQAKTTPTLSFGNQTEFTLTIGDTFTAPTLTGVPEGGKVTYESSNPNVATVDQNGNVTLVAGAIGSTTIKATYNGNDQYNSATASYTITVKDKVEAIAAPTFAPAGGTTYTEPKWVAIACATPGATIEYTMDGETKTYDGPFLVDHNCVVTATAKMGTRTIYTPTTSSAEYNFNILPAAAITDNYYNLINNGLNNKFANVAGRRTLNFVDDPAAEAGTIFRIATDGNGKVLTLRSQACDIQDYAKRAMNYVPVIVQTVINKLNNTTDVDSISGAGNLLGENGFEAIMKAFNDCFDYNLYVEGSKDNYRIYARTPSMQNVVDFYAQHKDQVDEKLPMLEGYINQVLAKIRSKVPAPYNANVFEPFSLLTVWSEMGGTLIKPDTEENVKRFYEQVLTNKEYVWNFAKTTAKHYLDNIKGTQTYQGLVAQYPDINIYVSKLEEIRPETKFFIIQNGNEPDYVGETHTYIVNDYAQTYWTLAERTGYDVTFPAENVYNGQLVTTLYTDFAYDVPDGVTAYKVTGVKTVNEQAIAEIEALNGTVPAQTPVLLMTPAAKANVTKTVTLNTNDGTPIENELKGPDYLIKQYGITSPTVDFIFNAVAGIVPADMLAEYEYLKLRTSGTVNNKYFWNVNDALDFDGDCIVRSLAVKDNELAFSEHWKTETNKAFLVSETDEVIYLAKAVKPTFDPFPGSYNETQTVKIDAGGAEIEYSTDGGNTWQDYSDPIPVTEDMTIIARVKGIGETPQATGVYVINKPVEPITIDGFKGYFQIKNNGNGKYANVAGRKTLNFVEDPADKAGTVIYADIQTDGKVISLRSQAADLQRYADRAMSYVPEIVELVAEKLNADGSGQILGEHGLDAIMEKFNKSFDHHLYVEPAEGGYRIFGRTPSMQPVVDFYRENKDRVEAKLPMLESFINSALDKLKEKLGGGSTVFTPFSLHQIWENMNTTLTEPTDDVTTMTFYREVLNNKNYVWDFAYQTALIYLNNVTSHSQWASIEAQLGEYAQYIDMLKQVKPEFKYYIVQKDGKPDFISEGNVDIINNADRTIWTVQPRTTFTVNIADNLFGCPLAGGVGGYATTLYTDFAYTVPNGVTAYKVTSIDGGNATIEPLSGVIPAQTPVLLTAKEAGTATLTLSTEAGTAVTGNLLVGPDYLINEYDLKTTQVQDIFNMIKQKFGEDFYNAYVAQYEHLADLNSGTVNNKYFWGLKESDIDKCSNDGGENCVVRNLEDGKFIDNWKVETNKAFLVTDEYAEITLNTLRGDVNHDGKVNLLDVTDLIDRLLVIPDAEHLKACPYCSDVNGDSLVNIKDVTVLIDILLENPATDPEEGDGN